VAGEDVLDDRDRSAHDDCEDPELAVMLAATSIARMVMLSSALVAAGGALLLLGVPQVRRELPVEAGAPAAARSTVGAASLAAARRSSDVGDEFTPVFDIARIDPTGDAVIAGRAAAWNYCATVTCMIERSQIVLDSSSWSLRGCPRGTMS
jgi:hypothetical protein